MRDALMLIIGELFRSVIVFISWNQRFDRMMFYEYGLKKMVIMSLIRFFHNFYSKREYRSFRPFCLTAFTAVPIQVVKHKGDKSYQPTLRTT